MDRALNPELIDVALGGAQGLPAADALIGMIADLEIALFAGWPIAGNQELLNAAWYLHGIASSVDSLESYGLERQRRAFQVSAHVFDLQATDATIPSEERHTYLFACQVGYLRAGLSPNARAVFRREWTEEITPDLNDLAGVALAVGCLLLSGEYGAANGLAQRILLQARDLVSETPVENLFGTGFDAVLRLCQGSEDMAAYFTSGASQRLTEARTHFLSAATSHSAAGDLNSRWIAAHLYRLCEDLSSSSIWTVLPRDLPPSVGRAFALGKPSVTSLWPPQAASLAGSQVSLLDPSVTRAVLSLPTSTGKSLVAQIVAAVHIARGASSVCYVVPTNSLRREIQDTFESRLRLIATMGDEKPDFHVMTPERLYSSLRFDPAQVLDQYGLFIIDEAQSLADGARGWKLESVIALLHAATKGLPHRIILISPAAGNLVQIATWMGASEEGQLVFQSNWRGPRRLNAVYQAVPNWGEAEESARRSSGWPVRRTVPLYGQVRLHVTASLSSQTLTLRDRIGELQLQVKADGETQKRETITAQYMLNLPMIEHLGASGSVLVLAGSRASCVRYARALSERLGPVDVPLSLIGAISGKLGAEHPLTQALHSGVAYHHAGLPVDVQTVLEAAVRKGDLNYLIATTTLTEGVNLPVRSVFIAETGFHDGTQHQRVLTGPRLANAVGRAGRALAETEGWAVLADKNVPEEEFAHIDQQFEAMTIASSLSTDDALACLEELEALLLSGNDVLFAAEGLAADFVSYNWFLMEACELLRSHPYSVEAKNVLEATLAWQQLPRKLRDRWDSVAVHSRRAYEHTDPARRRRWVTSGLPLSTASLLEELAGQLSAQFASSVDVLDPIASLDAIESAGILARILQFPAAPKVPVFTARRGSGRALLDFSLPRVLRDWLAGDEMGVIAQRHLSAVKDSDYRDEQMSDLVSSVFINYLPWVLGVLMQWTWELVEEEGEPATFGGFLRQLVRDGGGIPSDVLSLLEQQSPVMTLPAMIRYGVNNWGALRLVQSGVSSRALAVRAGDLYDDSNGDSDVGQLRQWLRDLGMEAWMRVLGASPLDLNDLLRFTRTPTSTLLSDVLDGQTIRVPLEPVCATVRGTALAPRRLSEGTMSGRLGLYDSGALCACIPLAHQHDFERLTELGVPLRLIADEDEDGMAVMVSLDRSVFMLGSGGV